MAHNPILVVDADEKSQRVLELGLKKAGYSVQIAQNGREAMSWLEDNTPGLIISGINLPRMSGFAFCSQVKENLDLEPIPFIFLTSQSNPEDRVQGYELVVEDFLTKPIYIKEITTRVQLLLQRREKDLLAVADAEESSGDLGDVTTIDLLQTIEDNNRSGIIEFTRGSRHRGVLYFTEGRVVDAAVGKLRGADAVYRLFQWNEGAFVIRYLPVIRRPDRVQMPTADLLIEGMQRLAEWEDAGAKTEGLDRIYEVNYQKLADYLRDLPDEVNAIIRLFDGYRTVNDVLDDSPLSSLKTIRIIERLQSQDLVRDITPQRRAEERELTGSFDATDTVELGDWLEMEVAETTRPRASRTPEPETEAEKVRRRREERKRRKLESKRRRAERLSGDHAAVRLTTSSRSVPAKTTSSRRVRRKGDDAPVAAAPVAASVAPVSASVPSPEEAPAPDVAISPENAALKAQLEAVLSQTQELQALTGQLHGQLEAEQIAEKEAHAELQRAAAEKVAAEEARQAKEQAEAEAEALRRQIEEARQLAQRLTQEHQRLSGELETQKSRSLDTHQRLSAVQSGSAEAEGVLAESLQQDARNEAEAKEAEARAHEEAKRVADLEAARLAQEVAEREAKEAAEREAREEEERVLKAAMKLIAEREAKEAAELEAKAAAELEAKEAAERAAKEKAEREAKEAAEREAKAAAEREAKEAAELEAKAAAEREGKEATERAAQEKAEREAKEKAEADARAAEEAKRKESERIAKEELDAKAAAASALAEAARRRDSDSKRKAKEKAEEERRQRDLEEAASRAKAEAKDDELGKAITREMARAPELGSSKKAKPEAIESPEKEDKGEETAVVAAIGGKGSDPDFDNAEDSFFSRPADEAYDYDYPAEGSSNKIPYFVAAVVVALCVIGVVYYAQNQDDDLGKLAKNSAANISDLNKKPAIQLPEGQTTGSAEAKANVPAIPDAEVAKVAGDIAETHVIIPSTQLARLMAGLDPETGESLVKTDDGEEGEGEGEGEGDTVADAAKDEAGGDKVEDSAKDDAKDDVKEVAKAEPAKAAEKKKDTKVAAAANKANAKKEPWERKTKPAERETPIAAMPDPGLNDMDDAAKKRAVQNSLKKGSRLVAQGKADAGLEELNKAYQLAPGSARVNLALGQAYRKKQKHGAAITHLERAVKANPKNASAIEQLGTAYMAGGKRGKAVDAYKKYLQLKPEGKTSEAIRKILGSQGHNANN